MGPKLVTGGRMNLNRIAELQIQLEGVTRQYHSVTRTIRLELQTCTLDDLKKILPGCTWRFLKRGALSLTHRSSKMIIHIYCRSSVELYIYVGRLRTYVTLASEESKLLGA